MKAHGRGRGEVESRGQVVGRLEQKIIRLNDQLAAIQEEERLVAEELTYHRHINDDAQRDAAIGNADDRAFAYDSAHDVQRFERELAKLRGRRERLAARRDALLEKL